MISVRLSGRPSGCVKKINIGLFSKTMVPSRIKLGMIVTTMELYTAIPLLVTFDLYLGHRVNISVNRQFPCLRNSACHQNETWY